MTYSQALKQIDAEREALRLMQLSNAELCKVAEIRSMEDYRMFIPASQRLKKVTKSAR